MRPLPHSHTGEGATVLGVLLPTVPKPTAPAAAPRADRPIAVGTLLGAVTATFVVIAVVVHRHRRAQ
ncbi:hypothetical protein BIV25_21710 [Streptomyces sp. MUSC 14]|uniref:hypothetical protein n=1 Tax=Streptomyces sp. MUSC 14 TaxID=1354889 RepID=UPI0008F5A045|nr:hypothetical protein [Streptomyces sp. MUSC 14]OIJ94697.1 hypothetical protein BIV25_21710 [Streptomyces sp. MUSC 14]